MKNTQKLSVILGVLLVVIVGLSVAYAALSTTLSVNFTNVSSDAITWGGVSMSCSLTTTGGTSGTGRSCGAASGSGTSVTIADTSLSKPGDYCLYTCTLTNNSTIGVSLGSITSTAPTKSSGTESCSANGGTITCTYVKYQLCTAQSSGSCTTALSTSNGSISASSSKTVYLLVAYTSSSLNSSGAVLTNAKFQLVYNQA